jgi:AcrR family transcriptional regulator
MEKMSSRKNRKLGKRGPRPKREPRLDQDAIISAGLTLTKTLPLQDVSMVRLARKLGVTPASLHYYLDGRGALTASIVNCFFRELLSEWPALGANPLTNLEKVAWSIYRQYVCYPGIAAYFAGHNRFDLLVKSAHQPYSENLYRFIERYFAVVEFAGLSAESAAVYAFVLIQFTIAAAHTSASHQLPGPAAGRISGYSSYASQLFGTYGRRRLCGGTSVPDGRAACSPPYIYGEKCQTIKISAS